MGENSTGSASLYLSFDINMLVYVCNSTSKSREKICKSDLAFYYFNLAVTSQIIFAIDTTYNESEVFLHQDILNIDY